jgi:hypothetical protein
MRRISARALVGLSVALLLAGAAALALVGRSPGPDISPRAEAQRPPLMLLTTLPLVFPEEFSLQGGGSKALSAIETRYRVIPIGTTDAATLRQARLLLMAHPLAQPSEALVDLDRWVRGGGRVLLLADPRLEWPSKRPLGDLLRPSPMFMDTGLLAHWGLRLEAPDKHELDERKVGGFSVLTDSPGRLSGRCPVSADGLVAHCVSGRGKATIVADADLLDTARLGTRAKHNLDAILAELAALEDS